MIHSDEDSHNLESEKGGSHPTAGAAVAEVVEETASENQVVAVEEASELGSKIEDELQLDLDKERKAEGRKRWLEGAFEDSNLAAVDTGLDAMNIARRRKVARESGVRTDLRRGIRESPTKIESKERPLKLALS